MSNSKIEIKVGIVEFSGEGEQKWLSEQLDKILEKVPELLKIELSVPQTAASFEDSPSTVQSPNSEVASTLVKKPLATFIKENSPKTQPQLFLVTSIWIHDNLNKSRLQHQDINTELKKSNQKPIGKLSQELGRNVKAGFIVKDEKSFYVTPEGRKQF